MAYLELGHSVRGAQDTLGGVGRELCCLLILHLREQLLEALDDLHKGRGRDRDRGRPEQEPNWNHNWEKLLESAAWPVGQREGPQGGPLDDKNGVRSVYLRCPDASPEQ